MKTTPLNLRYATSDDVLELRSAFEVIVTPLVVYNQAMRNEQLATYTPDYFLEKITGDTRSIALAETQKGLSGYVITTYQGGPIWIDWVLIKPDAQGMGVGEKLVKFVMQEAKARNSHKVWCDTRTDNHPAIKLFKKFNFELKCELKDHWQHQDYYIWERFI
jgi:ribosomal protein S18 acetylase RimI-like enzyme